MLNISLLYITDYITLSTNGNCFLFVSKEEL